MGGSFHAHGPISEMIAIDDLRVSLVLAGGNALGAIQAGVDQALPEHGIEPNHVVGTSAGAVNAGNPPAARLAALSDLWRPLAQETGWPMWWDALPEDWRRTRDVIGTMLAGRPGLFRGVGSGADGHGGATPAIYDAQPLQQSLDRLVDFDRIAAGPTRFAALAVDLDSGEEALFDSATRTLDARHVRASAAMPPTFPAVEIDGRAYVDGGVSANLPFDPVLAPLDATPTLCVAVDLMPLAGERPDTIGAVVGRTQDLVFGCQSRRSIARWRSAYAHDPRRSGQSVTLVRLSYADQSREVAGKAMDFSPATIRDRWTAGHRAGAAMLRDLDGGKIVLGRAGLAFQDLD